MDDFSGTVASIAYPKGAFETPYDLREKFEGIVDFSQIDGATFTGDWVLGTVELDDDNVAYILIPREYLEEEE